MINGSSGLEVESKKKQKRKTKKDKKKTKREKNEGDTEMASLEPDAKSSIEEGEEQAS